MGEPIYAGGKGGYEKVAKERSVHGSKQALYRSTVKGQDSGVVSKASVGKLCDVVQESEE